MNQTIKQMSRKRYRFKLQEYEAIANFHRTSTLSFKIKTLICIPDQVKNAVDQIILVNSMLQTKALVGFTRNSPTKSRL